MRRTTALIASCTHRSVLQQNWVRLEYRQQAAVRQSCSLLRRRLSTSGLMASKAHPKRCARVTTHVRMSGMLRFCIACVAFAIANPRAVGSPGCGPCTVVPFQQKSEAVSSRDATRVSYLPRTVWFVYAVCASVTICAVMSKAWCRASSSTRCAPRPSASPSPSLRVTLLTSPHGRLMARPPVRPWLLCAQYLDLGTRQLVVCLSTLPVCQLVRLKKGQPPKRLTIEQSLEVSTIILMAPSRKSEPYCWLQASTPASVTQLLRFVALHDASM